jgi:hypothetical protein
MQSIIPFFTVPMGSVFVLTDLDFWVECNVCTELPEYTFRVVSDAAVEWTGRGIFKNGTAVQYKMEQVDWTTGLVFGPGQTAQISAFGYQGPLPNWHFSWSGYVASTTTGVGEETVPPLPASILGQNIPNPFSHGTQIQYSVTAPGATDLRIYDAQGRLVRKLVGRREETGDHTVVWDGRSDTGEAVSCGVYYYELVTATGHDARKAVVLR